MTNLSKVQAQTMSSREIATLCDKTHANVLRDIRAMLDNLGSSILNDEQYQILTDERGYMSEVLLNKNLTLVLVSGYNAKLRMAIIRRWQELEQTYALPTTYIDALQALLESEKQKQVLLIEQQKNAPKIAHYDFVVAKDGLINASQVGGKIGLSAVALNRHLDTFGVYNKTIKRNKRTFNHWFIEQGFGVMRQTDTGHEQGLFTRLGEAWIVERLASEGVIV